eukprot:CAMPEP_0206136888 /NCGR_PEP_ID=MMETSP1473-20131121/2104_1 /ASSEMBLY_ACC=CAM_ASM_001109 /TAXON_ID=1461547 /ORGANISM="Stichococcus sp, Strain RCC1054" /LENGTH=757 /DNA_ID=CAMNT_0053529723 /DNA_START=157 /DNA_END=2430 /DNA_ORIENTATION=-
MASLNIVTSTIGFPRIGPNREMKRALESYWKKKSTEEDLLKVAAKVDHDAWKAQADAGVDLVGLDGTLYDQSLDWIFYLGLAPKRFAHLEGLTQYFAMARGTDEIQLALDMSKYLDTNYHYLKLEADADLKPTPNFAGFIDKVKRGQAAVGADKAVPIILGPNTLVGLATVAEGVSRSDLVARLVPAYVDLLQQLKELGVPEVQVHEPVLTLSHAAGLKDDFQKTFDAFAGAGVRINLVTAYDDIGDAYEWAIKLPVQAISLDFLGVPGSALGCATADLIAKHGFPQDKRLGAGIVDGRSVWADGDVPTALLGSLVKQGITNISVQSSVSLQHLPVDKRIEKGLAPQLLERLSFATQKLDEIVAAARAVAGLTPDQLDRLPAPKAPTDDQLELEEKLFERSEDFETRRPKQIDVPAFPTTTIGSFPQTNDIRNARKELREGTIDQTAYEKRVNEYMAYAIDVQEKIGLDVLVHGEPERSDMVEYFGQKLDGFEFTTGGWVQSYGSRYVRPPLIYDDVSRPAAMTVKEFQYAQSLTRKPVKGMLTGPVTILNWSFPRKDVSRSVQAAQLALALRKEMVDLEAAGCKVIQVDEPALREGLPLKKERWESYLAWAVRSFRLATSVVKPETQVVTHLCYSDFEDILPAIDGLKADVLTIENSRSGDAMIRALAEFGYSRDLGPGVYDVHSPAVPPVEGVRGKIKSFVDTGILGGHPERLWINPDCGLKTRDWAEVSASLINMVKAAAEMRALSNIAKSQAN